MSEELTNAEVDALLKRHEGVPTDKAQLERVMGKFAEKLAARTHTAAELVAALEAGKHVRKVLDPAMSDPVCVTLFFTYWSAGRQRVLELRCNYPLQSHMSGAARWLTAMLERPDEWDIVDSSKGESR